MIELFKAVHYRCDIEKVEATRVTDKSYWYLWNGKEMRRARNTTDDPVFETYAEAWSYLRQRLERKRETLQRQITMIENDMERLEQYRPMAD